MVTKEYEAPCGMLLLGVNGSRLCLCDWMVDGRIEKTMRRLGRLLPGEDMDDRSLLHRAEKELDEFFEGRRQVFNIPLTAPGTDFQRSVWKVLRKIGYGEVVSYSSIAAKIGSPNSVRAVANAIGANPISILIPCHRIIGSDGSLTGYAGGLPAKRYLLELEQCGGYRFIIKSEGKAKSGVG